MYAQSALCKKIYQVKKKTIIYYLLSEGTMWSVMDKEESK